MNDYDASTYGDRIADFYDDEAVFGLPPDTDATVGFLASVAGCGPVLELAIGTGRIALPFAQGGFEVHGIDASERMVARLRAKPGGESIPVSREAPLGVPRICGGGVPAGCGSPPP